MSDLDMETTDGTSIQPVSSLRARFEHMTDPNMRLEPSSVAILQKKTLQHFQSQIATEIPENTSQDSSHGFSPFPPPEAPDKGSYQGVAVSEGTKKPENPDTQQPPSVASLRRRNILTNTPSLAKSSHTIKTESVKSETLTAAKISSKTLKSTPPKRLVSHSSPLPGEHLLSTGSNTAYGTTAQKAGFGATQDNIAPSSSSTPISRAGKPKIPTKPLGRAHSSFGHFDDNCTRKLYSSNTPYIDDGSSNISIVTSKPIISNLLPNTDFSESRKEKHIPALVARDSEKPAQLVQGIILEKKLVKHNIDRNGFSQQQLQSPGKKPGFLPGLPPRRKADDMPLQRPAVLQRARTEQTSRFEDLPLRAQSIVSSSSSKADCGASGSTWNSMPSPKTLQPYMGFESKSEYSRIPPQTQSTSRGSEIIPKLCGSLDPKPDEISVKQYMDYPTISLVNRRPPHSTDGVQVIETNYDTKLFDMSKRYICTTGYLTKAWDPNTGELVMNLDLGDKETRATAIGFKPGARIEDEGTRIWLGTNHGELHEVDIHTQKVLYTKSAAHNGQEIIKIYRYQKSMWVLDDEGKLFVWHADNTGLPNLQSDPYAWRVPKGHTFSLTVHDTLWLASGREIRVFRPNSGKDATFLVREIFPNQSGTGDVTAGTIIPSQPHVVYFGHADGKVTTYSTVNFNCLGIFNVNTYKVNCLSGVGSYLWAGYGNGVMYVYDTTTQPWTTRKAWQAHDQPIANILVDQSSIWKSGPLRVASIGTDNAVKLWDGGLEYDWLENDMRGHSVDYCSFREITVAVVTWNAGASTPSNLRRDETDVKFFHEMLHVEAPPDLLVFGFQELVDLEDKKLTARSLFKSSKKKDSSEQERMSHQYRAWRDYLIRCIEDRMPLNEPYILLHTASMIGLFSCVFVKASQHGQIKNINTAEIKRGLGGLHGNKGALITRFIFDDSSICLINCHLAAGQSQTIHRNNDVAAILESVVLPLEGDSTFRSNVFVGGGDGSMILDHEVCVLNGDLNYRIDTTGRETVIKAINAKNYSRLLERDQLLVSKRRTPGFQLRAFHESPITFAPTYKYDVGSDAYDTSVKHRAPAWCDRILYRGDGNVKQLEYRRHEIQASDHRPVSALFVMRVKKIIPLKRNLAWEACRSRFEAHKQEISRGVKAIYFRDVLGAETDEASIS